MLFVISCASLWPSLFVAIWYVGLCCGDAFPTNAAPADYPHSFCHRRDELGDGFNHRLLPVGRGSLHFFLHHLSGASDADSYPPIDAEAGMEGEESAAGDVFSDRRSAAGAGVRHCVARPLYFVGAGCEQSTDHGIRSTAG